MNIRSSVVVVLGISGLCALAGCATGEDAISHDAVRPAVILNDNPAGFEQFVEASRNADVVLIGELHGVEPGLTLAADLWERIAPDSPKAALALEFFERDQQLFIDDYLAGYIPDEAKFKELTARDEDSYPEGHRRMLETAKLYGLPVLAANAPRRYVRMVRGGYDALRALPRDRQHLFVIPREMPGGKYRDDFYSMDFGHGDMAANHQMADSMFRSQAMWDATMADTVVRSARAGHKPVVLVIGGFHVQNDGGTKQFIERDLPGANVVTFAVVREGSTEEPIPSEFADFVLMVPAPDETADP